MIGPLESVKLTLSCRHHVSHLTIEPPACVFCRVVIGNCANQCCLVRQVTIAYTDVLDPRQLRRENLRRRFCFDCTCERCTQDPSLAGPPSHPQPFSPIHHCNEAMIAPASRQFAGRRRHATWADRYVSTAWLMGERHDRIACGAGDRCLGDFGAGGIAAESALSTAVAQGTQAFLEQVTDYLLSCDWAGTGVRALCLQGHAHTCM